MAYLGLNTLPQYNPANSPLQQGISTYQNMQQFPLLQAKRQAAIQQQQIANQYAPQIDQASIAQTQAQAALQKAQSNSPEINPQGNATALYQAWLGSSNPQEKAMYGALLNRSLMNNGMYGIPGMMAQGIFNTNPNSYGSSQNSQPPPQGSQLSTITGGPPPVQQFANTGSAYGFQGSQGMPPSSWQAGQLPPVNPNQSPQGIIPNMMTMYRAPKQISLNNGQTSTVVSAPTTQAQTNQQNRDQALSELSYMAPFVNNAPYQGNFFQRDISPLWDLGKYGLGFGGNDLKNKLISADTAQRLTPSLGGLGARVALGANAGQGAQQQYEDAYSNNLPGSWIHGLFPQSITQAGKNNATSIEQNAGDIANKTLATGTPVQVPTNQLYNQGGNPTSYQQHNVIAPPSTQNQSSQQVPNFPSFNKLEDARAWFKSQPYSVQQAYLKSMGNK